MNQTTPADIESVVKEAPSSVNKKWVPWVWLSIALAIAAWCLMPFIEYASFGCGIAGLVLSILSAIFVGRGGWRDAAITAAVAAGTLVVVYVAFYSAISIVFKSI